MSALRRMAVDARARVYATALACKDLPCRNCTSRISPGAVDDYGPRLVTREEIIAFAAEFDPQPMHLDEEAGGHRMLGGLAASGWHTCASDAA